MATVKIKLRTSSIANKEGAIYYQVIHKRVPRQIRTDYRLFPAEWDVEHSEVVASFFCDESRRRYLHHVQECIIRDCKRLEQAICKLEQEHTYYTADMVVDRYRKPSESHKCGFVAYALYLIARLRKMGRMRTAATYATTLNRFLRFCSNEEVYWDMFDSLLMQTYEQYMKADELCPNTTSFYMRNLRAIYNRAVEEGITTQIYPFRHVYTGIDKTVKRAISIEDIKKILNIDLALDPKSELARDIYLFSFYTRGMSFVDIAFLRKSDIQNGVLSYRRHKTGQQLFIKWEKQMQDIVDKNDVSDTPYLLPIIKDCSKDERKQYKSALSMVNRKLEKIGKQLKLPIKLSSYTARHSWGSAAKCKNIPISVISQAMGHDSEKTTQIYLASLDTAVVDEANKMILNSLE